MKRTLLIALTVILFPIFSNAQGPCVGSESLTATPPPNNGFYYPGTVVTFCYTVTNYAQTSADWMCGAVPTLGPGWDLSTLTPISAPASCDGFGNWAWYPSCTATGSGQTFGAGFYYDSPQGNANNVLDGIPGNNFGDNCANYVWTFCFSVMVAANAPNGTDLTVTMTSYSDYQVGSWGQDGCQDPPNPFNTQPAVVANCVLIVPTVTITNSSCANTNDGSITVSANGVAPYFFLWSTGATVDNINNLNPGIYTVTVTDSTGCSKVVTIPVGGPAPINTNAVVVPNGCTTGGGSITLAPSGGTGSAYTYLWSDGTTASGLSNLTGGTYIVTVTDSLSCTQIDTFNIINTVPITLTASSTSTGCTGTTGTATVVASGGTPPFTYNWSPIGGTGATATNLPSGTYTVTVSDASGCTSDIQVAVQAIGSFTLTTQYVPLGCDPAGTTTADVQITGGTAPFTYLWTPTGGTGQTGTGLTAGTYIVYVTDSNSCIDSATVIIPAVIPITVSTVSTPVQCGVPNSGTATVTASGGSGTLTYMWSDGTTSSTAVNLNGGTYTVTVTDPSGCTATNTVTVAVIPEVFADAGLAQSVCSGLPVTLTGNATGGTAPFSYMWDNGSAGAVITVNPTVTTTYTLTVTDANSCTSVSTVIVTAFDFPVVTMSADAEICFGSNTVISATGGNSYTWTPASGLSDATIANPTAAPNATTTYVVAVSNGNCITTDSVTVTVAPQLIAAFTADSTLGVAPLTVNFNSTTSGAVAYNWDFGDGNTGTGQSVTHTYSQDGNFIVTLTVENSIGCIDTARFSTIDVIATLTIPNVFTPNGDGSNDTFHLMERGLASISVVILNRWGNEVYSWSGLNGSWDGEGASDGVYLCIIKASGASGKSYDYQGTVQLIRNKK